MKQLLLIVVLAVALAISGSRQPAASAQSSPQSPSEPANAHPAIPANRGADQENARQARALLNQAIQALGGQAYLNIRDMQQLGRTYSFYHGRSTGAGALFWRFVEYPDKERLEGIG